MLVTVTAHTRESFVGSALVPNTSHKTLLFAYHLVSPRQRHAPFQLSIHVLMVEKKALNFLKVQAGKNICVAGDVSYIGGHDYEIKLFGLRLSVQTVPHTRVYPK